MTDLIKAFNATYGLTFTIVIFTIVMIYTVFFAVLPFLYWSIHNRTTKATEELNKLKNLIENLNFQQNPNDRLKKQSSEHRSERTLRASQIETLPKDRLPESDYAHRKVFHEKDDDPSDNPQSAETIKQGQIKPFPIRPNR